MDRAKALKDTVAVTGKKTNRNFNLKLLRLQWRKIFENLIRLLIYCLKYINKVMFYVMLFFSWTSRKSTIHKYLHYRNKINIVIVFDFGQPLNVNQIIV